MPNQDERYSQLLRNIDQITQMAFDAYEKGSTCILQFIFLDGKLNGFRREERFPVNQFHEAEKISRLKELLKSGYGKVTLHYKDNSVILFVAEETIKPVP